VSFSNYEPLPRGVVGHPKGLAWFCPDHIREAQKLASLTQAEALAEMRKTP
jgi:hypothetical protein